jgi:hypothetical protein
MQEDPKRKDLGVYVSAVDVLTITVVLHGNCEKNTTTQIIILSPCGLGVWKTTSLP